ncbi:MAG: hypothetical protein K9K88_18155 [Desulfobacterales bacterium]|nr:hypothetical protein [Desulfobacterales bacterium]
MPQEADTLLIHVNVEIEPEALKAIVEGVKQKVGRNEKGHYQADTAAAVGEMISRFMREKEFTAWVRSSPADG